MTDIKEILTNIYCLSRPVVQSKITYDQRTFNAAFFQLDLKLNSETGGDLSTFIPNGEWEVIGEQNILNCFFLDFMLPDVKVFD